MNDSNPAMHNITPFWQMTISEAAKARYSKRPLRTTFLQDLTMASASSLPTVSLPLTALYSGAVGVLFALLSLRAFLYRGSKGAKAYFGDQNIPAAPKLQSVVRVRGTHSENRSACMLHASFL